VLNFFKKKNVNQGEVSPLVPGLLVNVREGEVSESSYTPPTDRRTQICPNCSGELKKIPGAKTKCPHCSKFIYVRTDPNKNERVLVAEADLEAMDDEIAKANGFWEDRLRKKTAANEFRSDWLKKHGSLPQESDVEWNVLVKESLYLAGQGSWGLWRNNEYEMASKALKQKQFKEAYLHFCIVAISDFEDGVSLGQTQSSLVSSQYLAPGKGGANQAMADGTIAASTAEELFKKAFEAYRQTGQGKALKMETVKRIFDKTEA
jgi:hypothetical protein